MTNPHLAPQMSTWFSQAWKSISMIERIISSGIFLRNGKQVRESELFQRIRSTPPIPVIQPILLWNLAWRVRSPVFTLRKSSCFFHFGSREPGRFSPSKSWTRQCNEEKLHLGLGVWSTALSSRGKQPKKNIEKQRHRARNNQRTTSNQQQSTVFLYFHFDRFGGTVNKMTSCLHFLEGGVQTRPRS